MKKKDENKDTIKIDNYNTKGKYTFFFFKLSPKT
jgi:hypothetical protein